MGKAVRGISRSLAALAMLIALPGATRPAPPSPVIWVWERPEDLRFAGPDVTIAILAGTVRLSGALVLMQPRLQPAMVTPSQPIISVVHVEIAGPRHPVWDASQRAETAAVVLALLKHPRYAAAQIDFEVKASDRQVLLDLLVDVRAGLGSRSLSMTALASWCDTETWIDTAQADEIVPMLFRMGGAGEPLRQRLAHGGDFRQTRCRSSVGIATDTPPDALPPGRKVWIFNPRRWTAGDLIALRSRLNI